MRARRRGETASVFLPSVPQLLGTPAEMEVERDHALDRPAKEDRTSFDAEDALLAEANRAQDGPAPTTSWQFEALEAEATFDRVLFDGGEFGTGEARRGVATRRPTSSGCPGCSSPTRSRRCCAPGRARSRRAAQAGRRRPRRLRTAAPPGAPRRCARSSTGWSAAWHHRTGMPHGAIHTELRQACGGPLAAQASAEQLQARIDLIRAWALRRR